ncbi:MAG TPA: hypothetical protein VGD50_03755 [Candidatus Baltobacteraceae bacterium]
MSVMTSTDDVMHPEDHPTDRSVKEAILHAGGVIGYWKDQPLLLPHAAQALGETDDYVHVSAIAVSAIPEGLPKHRIYLEVNDHGDQRWIGLDAYDTQNPCVEGHRSM